MSIVLVVEDEQRIREPQIDLLALEGYTAIGAHDPNAALTILMHTHIDAVITDIRLGADRDGIWLAEQAASRNVHVVLVTGYSFEEQQGRARPEWQLITKPFTVTELVKALKNLGVMPLLA